MFFGIGTPIDNTLLKMILKYLTKKLKQQNNKEDNIMKLVRFNSQFPTLLDKFFNDDFNVTLGRDFSNNVPAVNVKENENDFSIELAVPGLSKEDFKLNVEHDVLTISAEKKAETEQKEENYTRREFSFSSFKRSFKLPKGVNSDAIGANYKDGVVYITVPKAAEAKAREIVIS